MPPLNAPREPRSLAETVADRWDRFWFEYEIAGARLAAFRVAFFGLVGIDGWLKIAHAPRYGAGTLHVPHVEFLADVLPAPTRLTAAFVFVATAWLGLRAAAGVRVRVHAAIAAVLYGTLYFWSQLDSWQHHYLIVLVLAASPFVPWERATPGTRVRSAAIRLVLVQMSIVYAFAALSKLDAFWLSGGALAAQLPVDSAGGSIVARLGGIAEALGGSTAWVWATLGTGTVVAELFLAVALHVRRWRGAACLVALGLHGGIELSGYDIGLFSAYVATLFLLVAPVPAFVRRRVERTVERRRKRRSRDPGASPRRALPAVAAAAIVGATPLLALRIPESIPIAVGVAALALAIDGTATARGLGWKKAAAAHAGAAVALAALAWTTPHARDYHRYLGGDLRRRGDTAGAIEAYRGAVAIDPDYAAGFARLGDELWRAGDRDAALDAYLRARSLAPGDWRMDRRVAMLADLLGDTERAVDAARRVLARVPGQEDAVRILERRAGTVQRRSMP